MKRKLTIASAVSLAVLPMLMPAKDASAIPSFARKYGTSCYTCHSGFPNRNAFGEAFKNNGYRWPGGEDEDKSKQEQLKMGADGWKKSFPESPWPAEIPGYAPVALWVRGNLVDYKGNFTTRGGVQTDARLQQGAAGMLNNATIFFGGTMGDNLSTLVQYNPTAGSSTGQIVWNFKPGLKLSFGNGFTDLSFGNQTNVGSVSGLVPGLGSSAELVYIPQDKLKLTFGVGQASSAAPANDEKWGDSRYVRAKYKIGGAGLLSGAGGTYGNEFVGLDNNVTFGATVFQASPTTATGNYAISIAPYASNTQNEHLVYEGDVSGSYGSFMGSLGLSYSSVLRKNNLRADVGYFIYPWLKGTATYQSLQSALNPSLALGMTAHLRANASLAATYTCFSKKWSSPNTAATTAENANTFLLAGAFAF
ncbi:MAG: hypothetical protein HGA97_11440 [Chlorobiaceae bacterium]|nr:hypothetical protein [Chlorobiaceae bacterium]